MDDDALLRAFEDRTLPFERWTHRTHLKVGYLYLSRHPFAEALSRIRAGIQAYNAANDVPEGPTTGYHETMTHAFMRLIDVVLSEYGPYPDADAFVDDHPELGNKQVLRLFYTRGRFLHPDAKARFLEPDLAPLPTSTRSGG